MIVLFTDFGLHGPYTGQVKAVLHQMAPGVPAIDLFADAPVGNPKASAYLLAVYAAWFPVETVFLCIVDPGVGGTRPAMVLEADNAIEKLRKVMGATDPGKADTGTIRKQFGTNIERNAIHGSDGPDTAAFEIAYFFNQLEIV